MPRNHALLPLIQPLMAGAMPEVCLGEPVRLYTGRCLKHVQVSAGRSDWLRGKDIHTALGSSSLFTQAGREPVGFPTTALGALHL